MNIDGAHIGQRIREVRTWRGLSVAALASLAGISASYLSMIEHGQRPVTKRSLLESLAQALRVSPVELTGKPYPPTDSTSNQSHAAMAAVEDALTSWRIGEVPGTPSRPWPEIQSDLDRLNSVLSPTADYVAQGAMLPGLIRDLLTVADNRANDAERRPPALAGLLDAYRVATYVMYYRGRSGAAMLAVERMRQAAEELGDPVSCALVAWVRASILNGPDRARRYDLAVAAADMRPSRPEVQGIANLTAALAAASRGHRDTAQTHLTEAASLAEAMDLDVSPFADLRFGRTNVGIWRVAIAVELGDGARVAEIANGLRLDTITPVRQAVFWIDYGRGLLSERKTRERGIAALLTAEKIAPQRFRNDVFAREAVAALLHTARGDAMGRELRGLAWRMGLTPIG
jgi:transcriptional regulator with XRE-family HTH domain